jgi:uncharacterized membrane protein
MMRKSIFVVSIFIAVAAIITAAIYFSNYYQSQHIAKLKNEGMELVKQVENYRSRTHKIPQYMEDMHLDLPDDYPIYYNIQKDSINYTVSFQIAPFRSMAYYSDTKSWVSQ